MIELLRERRSIREYIDRPIEATKVALLKEAALRCPSSRNFDPWEFIFVDDRTLLKQLSSCKPHGARFLAQAPLGIVVCGDSQISDVWIEDCSIASILLQMVAQSLGLGSCWIQVRNRRYDDHTTAEQYVQRLLNVPEHVQVESIIAVGYPAQKRRPLPPESLKHAKVRMNGYHG